MAREPPRCPAATHRQHPVQADWLSPAGLGWNPAASRLAADWTCPVTQVSRRLLAVLADLNPVARPPPPHRACPAGAACPPVAAPPCWNPVARRPVADRVCAGRTARLNLPSRRPGRPGEHHFGRW